MEAALENAQEANENVSSLKILEGYLGKTDYKKLMKDVDFWLNKLNGNAYIHVHIKVSFYGKWYMINYYISNFNFIL